MFAARSDSNTKLNGTHHAKNVLDKRNNCLMQTALFPVTPVHILSGYRIVVN